ncbi:MAG: hypothetical protein II513_04225, partial [Ruminococcus sp.]|nr:hypothetical protein [Ruminococcus sp.]
CYISKRGNTENALRRCRATFPSGEGFGIIKRSLHSKTFSYNYKSLLLSGKQWVCPYGAKESLRRAFPFPANYALSIK